MAKGVVSWSQTAADNDDADSTVNWAEGMAPSAINNSGRAMMSSAALYRDDTAGSLETGGTTTAYTLSSNQVFASLAAMSGQELTIRFDQANGATPTLNVDSLGAKAININESTAVPTGFIAAGSIWRVTYDNSIPAFILNGVANVISAASVTTTGDVTVGDDLSVAGDSAITGNETVGGTLGVTGATTVDDLTVGGDQTVAGTFAVTGASTLTGALTANTLAGNLLKSVPKAHAVFAAPSGAVSFTAATQGFNIASIVRASQGVYTITFSTALPSANYGIAGGIETFSGAPGLVHAISKSTSGFTLKTYNVSAAITDPDVCEFVVFGF